VTTLADFPIEFRAVAARPALRGMTLTGVAANLGMYGKSRGGFVELFSVRAFSKALGDKHQVVVTAEGELSRLLGSTAAGTARLIVTRNASLVVSVDLPGTTDGRSVAHAAAEGRIAGVGLNYRVIRDRWELSENGFPVRVIEAAAPAVVGTLGVLPTRFDTNVARRSFAARLGVEVAELRDLGLAEIAARLSGADVPLTPRQRNAIAERQVWMDARRAELAAKIT